MKSEYLVSKWEVALMTFFMVFGLLCLPEELFGGRWGADTIARLVVSLAGAIVAVVARWRREVEERKFICEECSRDRGEEVRHG